MKVTIDTQDSLKVLVPEITALIRLALPAHYSLAVASGQMTDAEIQEGDELVKQQLPAGVPLPGAVNPAIVTPGTAPLVAANLIPSPGVDVDITGIPHDPRIHAKPAAGNAPTKNADGRWKKKKGIDDATFAAVTAELLRAMSASPTSAPTTLPVANAAPAAIVLPDANPAAPPASLPQLPPVTPVAAPLTVSDYPTFCQWLASAPATSIEGRPTKELVDRFLKHYGLVDAAGVPSLELAAHKEAAEPGWCVTFYNWLRVQVV